MAYVRTLAAAAALVACGTVAHAQTANSAGSSASTSGGSTVPQFPSGGTVSPNGGAAPVAAGSKIGPPTAVEQQEQRKSEQDTKICKGC